MSNGRKKGLKYTQNASGAVHLFLLTFESFARVSAQGRIPISDMGFGRKKKPTGMTGGKKREKPRLWSLDIADEEFSLYIRNLYGKCVFPGCRVTSVAELQCSHYIGRAHKATRFYPPNCIALCWYHHFKSKEYGLEYQKQREEKHGWDGRYTLLMKNTLGKEGWNELLRLEKTSQSQSSAIMRCMILLADTSQRKNHFRQEPNMVDNVQTVPST